MGRRYNLRRLYQWIDAKPRPDNGGAFSSHRAWNLFAFAMGR
jgi:hypothetical protein